jgi:hypothetical protein
MQRLCLDPDFSPDEAEEKARLISQVGRVQHLGPYSQHNQPNKLESYIHRDKTRVQMPAKMFPHLKLLCFLFMGSALGFWHEAKKQSLDQIWCFYNKSKILTILLVVKYEKITLEEFLVLLGPIISRFIACSNEEKNKQKQKKGLALVLSLWLHYTRLARLASYKHLSLSYEENEILWTWPLMVPRLLVENNLVDRHHADTKICRQSDQLGLFLLHFIFLLSRERA